MGQVSNPAIEKYLAELSQLSVRDQLMIVSRLTARLAERMAAESGTSEDLGVAEGGDGAG